MSKFWEVVKKYYEIIGFVLLTILLFCACFVEAFAWVVAVYAILFAVILRKETKLVGLLLYLNCFYALFNYQRIFSITLDIVLIGFSIIMLLGLYVFRVVKREQKLNWKPLIPVGLFFIYTVLPFHECNWRDFFAMLFFYVLVFVILENRKRIDFRYITRAFVLGIIVSSVFALFHNVSPLLTEKMEVVVYNGHFRFQGLSYHPNSLNTFIMLAICAMLILKYKNKISLVELLVTFVPMFIFGYLTISRSFVTTVAAGIVVFTVLSFFQNKVKALALFGTLLVMMCAIGGVFWGTTKVYHERMVDKPLLSSVVQCVSAGSFDLNTTGINDFFDEQSEEWQQAVYDGEVRFDPGRSALADLYVRDWRSSPKTIWLGRGISRPLIGQVSSHNLFLQELWKHGIVGYLFYAAIILSSVNWKKKRPSRHFLPVLIIAIPYFMVTMIEQSLFDYLPLMMIFTAVGCLEQPDGTAKHNAANTRPESDAEK